MEVLIKCLEMAPGSSAHANYSERFSLRRCPPSTEFAGRERTGVQRFLCFSLTHTHCSSKTISLYASAGIFEARVADHGGALAAWQHLDPRGAGGLTFAAARLYLRSDYDLPP